MLGSVVVEIYWFGWPTETDRAHFPVFVGFWETEVLGVFVDS